MAFSTGNPQFDFLMSRARNRRRSSDALKENNINVETSQEKMENSEGENNQNSVSSQVADISGLEASGISTTDVSVAAGSQSIADAQADINAASAMPGVGSQQTAGQIAFNTGIENAKADFAQSNPVGAAIAGFSTDAIAQAGLQVAPYGLAMAGKMEAAKAVANAASVLGGPVMSLISGTVGPTMSDPYGQDVAMGSGMLGQVSGAVMSTHFSVADKISQGIPGYTQGYYGQDLVSLHPGFIQSTTVPTTAAYGYELGMPLSNKPYSLLTPFRQPQTVSYTGPEFTAGGDYGLDPSNPAYGGPSAMSGYMSASSKSGYVGTLGNAITDARSGNKKAQKQLSILGINMDFPNQAPGGTPNDPDAASYGVDTNPGFGTDPMGNPTHSAAEVAANQAQIDAEAGFNVNNTFGDGNSTSNTSTDTSTDDVGGDGDEDSPDSGEDAMGGEDVAFGGKIGKAAGDVVQKPSTDMGFIGGPPDQFTKQQTIADDIPKEVPEGTFVINAPAVEFAGKEDIKQMLVEAYEIMSQADTDAGTGRTAQAAKIPSKEQVDIMISRGEVVVPPEIAKVIGYDRLEKINNRGKKEVSRRQEESQQQEKPQARQVAEGGFIDMQEGGNVEDDFGVTIENVKFKNFYSSPQIARKEIDKILNELPLEDALAIAMEGEADVLGDEGLEGVGHVFRNRAMAEGYKDFGNTLVEELGKKTYGKNKIFQFNALEPTKFRKTLNRFKQNKDRYLKVRNIAEDIVAGSRKDFTGGALFFKNPSSSEAQDFKSKVNSGEYVETGRTVNPKNKVFAHIYYKPKDFKVTDEMPTQVEESFVSVNNDDTQPPRKIPESTGGSFLGRGSAYETGGARPAFR